MIIVPSITILNMTPPPPSSIDQSTQVNFPVLLRSQQKALKRYATLSDINRPIPPRNYPNSSLWSTVSTISGHHHPRPRSLNFSGNTLDVNNLNNMQKDRVQKTSMELLSPMSTIGGPTGLSSGVSGTSGYRSRLGTFTTTAGSNDGSDVSFGDRYSPGFVYTGQYKAVHQSKWKIGLDNQPDSVSTGKTMCGCHQDIASPRHTTTPEALSWRRLHMSRAKLKATATTSELLSGFAMVAMVELQINEPTTVPEWLFVLFAVCTTILVAVHIFALMISTYILPNIDAISKLDVCELVSESPHERMRGFIELAWAFSTVLGLFLFLVEIAILCWVKFWDYSFTAAIAATIIVIPVLVMFVAFAVHFYHSLVAHKCDASTSDIQQLEDMKRTLDQAVSPV